MTNEEILIHALPENESISQRLLAHRTGISLGNINILLKRLISKGLLEIERMSRRTVRYILTPQGLAEKIELTYAYLQISCRFIISIENAVENIVREKQPQTIYLFDMKDDVLSIISSSLRQMKLPSCTIERMEQIPLNIGNKDIILAWEPKQIEQLKARGTDYCDVLRIAMELRNLSDIVDNKMIRGELYDTLY